MKKFLTLLMVVSIFSLVACGPTEEEKATAEAEAAAMVEDMMGGLEDAMADVVEEAELPVHVCDAKCEEAGECTGAKCGEAGHECTEACHEHKCSESCNTGTHKCGEHCGCGDGCTCAEGATCSGKCDIKEEVTEE